MMKELFLANLNAFSALTAKNIKTKKTKAQFLHIQLQNLTQYF